MATYVELINKLDVLNITEIKDYHKIPDIGGVIKITDRAVLLHLNYVGEDVWFPISLLRVGKEEKIWLQS